MTTEASNYQWPSCHDYLMGDRGTMALGVADIQAEIPEQVVAVENFETDPITGSGTWVLTNSNPHTGLRCLRSAVIFDNQSTDYTFTVPAPATTIKFWHRVSSENGFDFFEVYKDSITPANLLLQLSGTANIWQQSVFDITGVTSIIFRYIKDTSVSVGLDAAFIDDIEWVIPGVPGIQSYEPFHLTADRECVKVALCDNTVAITGIVDIRPLDCDTDSITICPPVSGLDVNVLNEVNVRPLDCDTDSVTICPPVSGLDVNVLNEVNVRPLDCDTDSVTICPPVSGLDVNVINEINVRPLDCDTDSITICPPVSGLDVNVINDIEIRPLDCDTDSVTICPGEQPIVVVPGTCFPVNVRLDCEVDSVTVCPSVSGFGVELESYPPAAALTDDGTPTLFTGAGSIADSTFRSFSITVLVGPVVVDGITVPTGFSISRSADPGGTVPGFGFNGTGGQIIVDTLREL